MNDTVAEHVGDGRSAVQLDGRTKSDTALSNQSSEVADAPHTAENENREDVFILEEYKMLRTEIERYSNQKRQLEIAVVTAMLVLYGWAFSSNVNPQLRLFVLWMPVVVVAFGVYRCVYYNAAIRKKVQYVAEKIEKRFLGVNGGWEEFWRQTHTIRILNATEFILWIVLALLACSAPLLAPLAM